MHLSASQRERPRFEGGNATEGTAARRGRLHTAHGVIETPQFMPVATAGTVRAQRTESLAPAGATMLLANTWHLAQRPGLEVLARMGGLHRFMRWPGGLLTDSGGFQVYSLGADASVAEEGVSLRHPGSGQRSGLTPESCIAAQRVIGSDVAMVLDHCVASTVDHAQAHQAMARTHRWAVRSLAARGEAPIGLFGIVQGATHPDLRCKSADFLTQLPFDGYAIGGLAVGESKAQREDLTELVAARLPADRPRYLMGVGTPLDLLEAVHRGVDLFDCILPTSLAQRGRVYTSTGRVDLRRGAYRCVDAPLDPACSCETCVRYSRAYLHHLFAAREPLAWTLLGLHNVQYWLNLMQRIRDSLDAGTFRVLYQAERERLDRPDDAAPTVLPKRGRKRPPPPETLGSYDVFELPGEGAAAPRFAIRHVDSGRVLDFTAPELPDVAALAATEGPALVVWELTLGAGNVAMALVRAWEVAAGPRELHLVSFAPDLDALRLAVANLERFPHLRHGGPVALLSGMPWLSRTGRVRWEVGVGAWNAQAEPQPDLILNGSGALGGTSGLREKPAE